jgi:hypothetical protein
MGNIAYSFTSFDSMKTMSARDPPVQELHMSTERRNFSPLKRSSNISKSGGMIESRYEMTGALQGSRSNPAISLAVNESGTPPKMEVTYPHPELHTRYPSVGRKWQDQEQDTDCTNYVSPSSEASSDTASQCAGYTYTEDRTSHSGSRSECQLAGEGDNCVCRSKVGSGRSVGCYVREGHKGLRVGHSHWGFSVSGSETADNDEGSSGSEGADDDSSGGTCRENNRLENTAVSESESEVSWPLGVGAVREGKMEDGEDGMWEERGGFLGNQSEKLGIHMLDDETLKTKITPARSAARTGTGVGEGYSLENLWWKAAGGSANTSLSIGDDGPRVGNNEKRGGEVWEDSLDLRKGWKERDFSTSTQTATVTETDSGGYWDASMRWHGSESLGMRMGSSVSKIRSADADYRSVVGVEKRTDWNPAGGYSEKGEVTCSERGKGDEREWIWVIRIEVERERVN